MNEIIHSIRRCCVATLCRATSKARIVVIVIEMKRNMWQIKIDKPLINHQTSMAFLTSFDKIMDGKKGEKFT